MMRVPEAVLGVLHERALRRTLAVIAKSET
jgi:hypothetical protein